MIRPISPLFAALCGALLLLPLAGCRKPQIRVYTVDREKPAAPVAPAPTESQRGGVPGTATRGSVPATRPPEPARHLDFQLPAGWQDVGASQFSLVNFRIPSAEGDAMVNITPLAGMAGRDSAIVNMWRQQLGQSPLDEAAAEASLTPVDIGGEQGKLFEVSGAKGGPSQRIVTAFVHRADGSWFYKLQGPDSVVAAQKPIFLAFLKTVKVKAGAVAAESPATPSEEPAPAVNVVAPEGWQAQTPGQMQVAKFSVTKPDGKADVSVSVFSSDTGGTLANVNRWRRQLGLADVDEAGLQECVSNLGAATIDGAPGPVLVELSKDNRGLLGAIVPRDGRYWFYKMVGDAPVVNAEHETFVQFVKSQP